MSSGFDDLGFLVTLGSDALETLRACLPDSHDRSPATPATIELIVEKLRSFGSKMLDLPDGEVTYDKILLALAEVVSGISLEGSKLPTVMLEDMIRALVLGKSSFRNYEELDRAISEGGYEAIRIGSMIKFSHIAPSRGTLADTVFNLFVLGKEVCRIMAAEELLAFVIRVGGLRQNVVAAS